MATFCDVSQAIRCGVSGIFEFTKRFLTTSSIKSFGLIISGLTTTGNPSTYPTCLTKSTKSSSAISPEIDVKPSRFPKTANEVWSGFKQVVTFIVSALSTVSRSVKITPAASSSGRPFGKLSSITR